MKKVTICITGGHLTPALAVIEEIQAHHPTWNLFFIGRKLALEGEKNSAHEERLVEDFGVPFYELKTGRIQRSFSFWTVFSFLKIPYGFFRALILLRTYKPTLVLSFGGYIALPVALAAWIYRIPVVTHEQTSVMGLANKIIASLATRVLVGDNSVRSGFSGGKIKVVGIPIRRKLFDPPNSPTFLIDTKLPLIYITGGSTGAMSLNAFVYPNVEELTRRYSIIHQVGGLNMEEASRVKVALPKLLQSRYVVAPYLDTSDVAWIYHHAILVIGRAGANTVAEVAALGLPALFIPLPWAAGNEQFLNAAHLEQLGTAVGLDQHTLTPASFMTHVEKMIRDISSYRSSAGKAARQYPRSAASNIVQEIATIIDPTAS